MTVSSDPRKGWRLGSVLLLIIPFIGLALILTDPPRWLQIVAVVVILVMVGAGSTLMRRRAGGWRPSETLARPSDN